MNIGEIIDPITLEPSCAGLVGRAWPIDFDAGRLAKGFNDGADIRNMMSRLERGERAIREPQRRLAEAYRDGYRPADWPVSE